ncbi:uncharacterized protein LOC1277100 [Anopheles gambiae]|uniref:uncharacterized protein LOC1277100 n=1 Tax=Anopheles gambiae TaxID=7165 RepID=UPI002AC9EFD5|nr:uncharacterized protein LOC1277100 [Anopheles gambiae]
MKSILVAFATLSVALVVVVAIPASFNYGGGGGYFINGTGQSFNFSGESNGTSIPGLPDFGSFLPNLANLTQQFGGSSGAFPQFSIPSWTNFTDAFSSIFPFFGNGQGGGFPFFG